MVDVYLHAKKNSIPNVFFEILYRYYKLVTLGNLGIPGNTHLNGSINLKKDIAKILKTCYFGYLGTPSYTQLKLCYQVVQNLVIPGYADLKPNYQLVDNFNVSLHATNKFPN